MRDVIVWLVLSSATAFGAETWSPLDSFNPGLHPDCWAIGNQGGTATTAEGNLVLDADRGSIELTSRQTVKEQSVRILDLVERQGRSWLAGLMSQDQKTCILIRRDNPNHDNLDLQILIGGSPVVNEMLGIPPAGGRLALQVAWTAGRMIVQIELNGQRICRKVLNEEDMPDVPLAVKFIVYSRTKLTVHRVEMQSTAARPPRPGQSLVSYPSIWDKATEVTQGAGLTWGPAAGQVWATDIPDKAASVLKVLDAAVKASSREALPVDARWTPLAMLMPVDSPQAPDAFCVGLPAWAGPGMRVVVVADESSRGNASSRAVRLRVVEAARKIILSGRASPVQWQARLWLRELANKDLIELAAAASTPPFAVEDLARAGKAMAVSNDQGTFLWNGLTGIGLAPAAHGAGLVSLYCATTGREGITRSAARPGLWQLKARRSDGTMATIASTETNVRPKVTTTADGDGKVTATLVWQNVRLPNLEGTADVQVTIALPAGETLAGWHIAIVNHLRGATLWQVFFPVISALGYPGQTDALVHTTYSMMHQGELHRGARGLLCWLYQGNPEASLYPSGSFPIQHLSMSIGSDTVVLQR